MATECALQATPSLGGGLCELEDHQLRRLPRQRSLAAHGSMPDGGENALDRVARTQVLALFTWEVVEGSSTLRHLVRQVTALSYLAPYFSAKESVVVSAAARVSACQISPRAVFTMGSDGPRGHGAASDHSPAATHPSREITLADRLWPV